MDVSYSHASGDRGSPPSYGTMETSGRNGHSGRHRDGHGAVIKRKGTTAVSGAAVKGGGGGSRRDRLQILLLCYVRMMEPLAFYTIFPYIAQMTKHNGNIPDADVGFYSGVFESLFSAVQSLVLLFWGSVADRVGHKPVLVLSLCGMAAGAALFGFSTSLWQMALFRCATGLFSGSNVMIRTMLMRHCTPATQARAFSWYTFADNLALFIGPLLGGALADPAGRYPELLEGVAPLFMRFPYALPGIVTGAACVTGAVVTLLFIDGDRDDGDDGLRGGAEYGRPADAAPDWPNDGEQDKGRGERDGLLLDAPPRPSLGQILRSPGVAASLGALMYLRVLGSSMMAVSTTALNAPVELGGMGYLSREIAALIAAQGAGEAVWLLLAFAPLHGRVGARGVISLCGVMYPLVFADYVALNELLRAGCEGGVWYWLALGALVVLGSGVLMGTASGQLALQDMSPDPRVLGTLNAVAEMCASVVKTVTPALSTAVFALGARSEVMRGHLVWVVLMLASPAVFVAVRFLPKDK